MSRERSWCSGFIPGFWWWFLALLGLPLLFLLMTYFRQGVIEGDLTNRVSNALSAESIDWAEVDVRHRGRDVMLRGIAPDEGARERAMGIAAGVEGVHRVDFENDVLQVTSETAESTVVMPTLNMTSKDGKLTLEGSLPSQPDIDRIMRAAGDRFGLDNVDDQLTVGAGVATPEWLSTPEDLLNILPDKDATLSIADGNVEISTEVNSDNVREDMLSRAKSLLGGEIVDSINVKPLPSPEVGMMLADGKLTLRGKVSSRAQMDELVQAAASRVRPVNVNNQLQVDEGVADAVWLGAASTVITDLLAEDGAAIIANDTLELRANVASEAARSELVEKSNTALKDSGLILVNNVTVTETPGAVAAQPDGQGEQNTAANDAGAASNPAAGGVQACQAEIDAAAKDKQVLFQVSKAGIRNESYALLDALAVILASCKAELAGQQVEIGGHTDSDGSKSANLKLSQQRAQAVFTYLSSKGLAADLMVVKGFGEAQPIATNATRAGKAQNRRISFKIKAAE